VDAEEGTYIILICWCNGMLTQSQADNLQGSGIESVLMTSLYAIVGAIALERGGEAANKVVQEKILAPLGFDFSAEL
jgi:large subunit ribosomal protein L15